MTNCGTCFRSCREQSNCLSRSVKSCVVCNMSNWQSVREEKAEEKQRVSEGEARGEPMAKRGTYFLEAELAEVFGALGVCGIAEGSASEHV